MNIILVINAGSSSIKYKLFDATNNNELASGQCEKIGNPMGIFSLKFNGKKFSEELPLANHQVGIKKILDTLLSKKVINSLDEIKGVGHRVVMGGKKYSQSVLVDDEAIQAFIDYSPLCPLHNPPEIETIKVFQKMIPNVPNVAVFDTSFHTSIPAHNGYAINKDVVEKYKIYRYGMHGTSYRYITQHMQKILNKQHVNLVICHLGNGASICEVKNAKSMNTTMGFTPVEGLVMGTRCGDVDPTIALYLIKQGLNADEVDNILNKQSGLKGICGTNDCRDLLALRDKGNKDAILAVEMFNSRVAKYVISFANEIGKNIDAIVFTGGIGENSTETISEVVEKLPLLNLKLDNNLLHQKYDDYKKISTNDSSIAIYQVRTNEELMIAQDVKRLAKI